VEQSAVWPYVILLITSLLHAYTFELTCLWSFNLSFLKQLKPISYTVLFLLRLYSSRLSQDYYIRYLSSFVDSSHTHFAITHPHAINANLYFIWVVYDLVVINFNFLGTISSCYSYIQLISYHRIFQFFDSAITIYCKVQMLIWQAQTAFPCWCAVKQSINQSTDKSRQTTLSWETEGRTKKSLHEAIWFFSHINEITYEKNWYKWIDEIEILA